MQPDVPPRSSAISISTATKLLTEHPECARALAKFRINPGTLAKIEARPGNSP